MSSKSRHTRNTDFACCSAGQIGPASPFFNDLHAPQHMSPETLGQAVFDDQTFADWAQLYSVNTASVFFVTMAFLGLLAKGSDDRAGYTSCVINVSSISGMWKVGQARVRTPTYLYRDAREGAHHSPSSRIAAPRQGCSTLRGCSPLNSR